MTDQMEELSRVLLEQDGRGKMKAYFVYGAEGLIGWEGSVCRYQNYHYDLCESIVEGQIFNWFGYVNGKNI